MTGCTQAPGKQVATQVDTPVPSPAAAPNGADLIDYPFPLRSGQVANLRLPKRLEKKDSERLGAFLETLVLEPQREIPAATGPAS